MHSTARPILPPRTIRLPVAGLTAAALLTGMWLSVQSLPAQADDSKPPTPSVSDSRYVLGLSVKSVPDYEGSDTRSTKIRPLWAYKYGRLRISTSGASTIMGFASDPIGPGLSAEFRPADDWRLSTALRFDSGRQSSDSSRLEGLPDIKRTLRGRVDLSYHINDAWHASATLSEDLLGHKGGGELGLNLGYRHWLDPRTRLAVGVGASLGDRQNMQSYFGISEASALKTGLSAFDASAGVKDYHANIGIMTALSERWVAYANVGLTRLVGDAAASPLTRSASSSEIGIGIAYRCCR